MVEDTKANHPNVDHELLRHLSPDGCCNKTRIIGWGCPVGCSCPFDKEAPDAG